MKDLLSILMLTLLGSMGVLAAPVEQYTEKDPKSVVSLLSICQWSCC